MIMWRQNYGGCLNIILKKWYEVYLYNYVQTMHVSKVELQAETDLHLPIHFVIFCPS